MASDSDMPVLITLVDRSANAPSQVNTNFTRVRTAFNDAFDTTNGHCHDGSDSRGIGTDLGNFTIAQMMLANMMGVF